MCHSFCSGRSLLGSGHPARYDIYQQPYILVRSCDSFYREWANGAWPILEMPFRKGACLRFPLPPRYRGLRDPQAVVKPQYGNCLVSESLCGGGCRITHTETLCEQTMNCYYVNPQMSTDFFVTAATIGLYVVRDQIGPHT